MQNLVQDIRYALRTLRRTPGATVVALVALSLGIGANTAIFSLVNAILIRPLPYRASERLVVVWENKLDKGMRKQLVSPLDYTDFAREDQAFERVGAFRTRP